MRCPYCQNTMVIPDALRRDEGPQVIVSTFGTRPRTVRAGAATKYVLVGIVVIILGSIFAVTQVINSAIDAARPPVVTRPPHIVIPPQPAIPPEA